MLIILRTFRHHKSIVVMALLEIALSFALITNIMFLLSGHVARVSLMTGLKDNQLVSIKITSDDDDNTNVSLSQTDLQSLKGIPGVKSAAQVNGLPLSKSSWNAPIYTHSGDGEPLLRRTPMYVGTKGFLETMGVTLSQGRDFLPDEYGDFSPLKGGRAPPVGIITEELAHRLWPNGSALGQVFFLGDKKEPVRVVGVASAVLSPDFHSIEDSALNIFLPAKSVTDGIYILSSDPLRKNEILSRATKELYSNDGNRIVLEASPYSRVVADFFLADVSAIRISITIIACLVALTCLGIVALSSLWVTQRKRHIGIRRALGAKRGDILLYFLSENMLVVAIGSLLGAISSLSLNRYVMQYFEVGRLPLLYVASGIALFAIMGQLSVLAPALRASRTQPHVAIRS